MTWNLKKLKYEADKNKFSLEDKESKVLFEKKINEVTVPDKPFFDSGWSASEIVSLEGSYTQEFEKKLPQKAKFNYSELINFSANMLPFLKYRLFFKIGDGSSEEKIYETEQQLIGVGKFDFSSLKEVIYNLYEWQGVTYQGSSSEGWSGWVENGESLGSAPVWDPSFELPEPQSAYEKSNYWVRIRVTSIGTGLGPYNLSPDGTMVRTSTSPEVWTPYLEWLNSVFVTYNPPSGAIFIEAEAAWANDFIYPFYFIIPTNTEISYSFPGNTDDNPDSHSTIAYPSQYWESQGFKTFQELLTDGTYTYSEALSIVTDYYPELIVTQEEEGPPYYSYEIIEEEKVVTGNQFFTIKKVDDDQFRINVNGYTLLLSKANKETSFSKEIAPTYEPEGDKVYTRLILYFQPNINPFENKSHEV